MGALLCPSYTLIEREIERRGRAADPPVESALARLVRRLI